MSDFAPIKLMFETIIDKQNKQDERLGSLEKSVDKVPDKMREFIEEQKKHCDNERNNNFTSLLKSVPKPVWYGLLTLFGAILTKYGFDVTLFQGE